jgi:hypothetical protein
VPKKKFASNTPALAFVFSFMSLFYFLPQLDEKPQPSQFRTDLCDGGCAKITGGVKFIKIEKGSIHTGVPFSLLYVPNVAL